MMLVPEGEMLGDRVMVSMTVGLDDSEGVMVRELVAELLAVALKVAVGVVVTVRLGVAVLVCVAVPVQVREATAV
jgi:hypothetical protein